MKRRDLAAVDLNLLVACEALLETGSVSAAARRLRLTQPATSHALARLRVLFDDPLLVRSGNRMVRTPGAERIAPLVRDALLGVRAVLDARPRFDPRTARRTFTIVASDYPALVALPAFVERLVVEAPGVDVVVRAAASGVLLDALVEVDADLVVSPLLEAADALPGLRSVRLWEDRFVCVLRRGHPVLARGCDASTFADLGHVLVAPRGIRPSSVDHALAAIGKRRRVVVEVPHFAVAPSLVARTDLVVTLPARLAALHLTTRREDVVVVDPPIPVPPFVFQAVWHERRQHDPAHAWLREQLVASCRGS